MPWKILKEDDQFCVVKEADGAVVKCHATRPEAVDHLKALYASETKELDQALANALVDPDAPPSWAGRLVADLTLAVKSLVAKAESNDPDMLIFKDASGAYQVITRYSNKFRDNDRPAEIIASESHQKFSKLVEVGLVKPPDLWLWHEPDWKIGTGLWAAYDDSGFALAGHRVPPEKAEFVELLRKSARDVRVSHGMPKWSVIRSADDPTVIVEHITQEVSLLPGWAAANKATSWVVLDDDLSAKENSMALTKEQKAELVQKFGISAEKLDKLEALNDLESKQLAAAGVENKEAADVQPPATPEPAPAAAPPAPASDNEDVIKALSTTIEAVAALAKKVDQLTLDVKEMKQSDAEKVAQKAANTPLASLADSLRKSVTDSPETIVDGRTSLAKSGPPQTEVEAPVVTRIPFVDQFFAPSVKQNGRQGGQ